MGVRLSPHLSAHDSAYTEAEVATLYLAKAFSEMGVAYLHIAEPDWAGGTKLTAAFRAQIRGAFKGVLIFCGGYGAADANALIAQGTADAVAFGRPYIANPNLVERFREGAELNQPDRSTFYGGGAHGYTDYPALQAQPA